MRKLSLLLIALVLFSFSVCASYNALYEIEDDKAYVTITTDKSELILPSDAERISADRDHYVTDYGSYKKLRTQSESITIRYETSSVIEKTKDRFFILSLSGLGDIDEIELALEESATLKYTTSSLQKSVIPSGKVSTDGKRIIISWDKTLLDGSDSIIVIYEVPKDSFYLPATIILAVLVFLAVFLMKRKGRSSFTRNLYEEEKMVVSQLIKAGPEGLWQKELMAATGLSKVKLSRKIRSLESKGVVEKIPYGNTNKIRLKT